MSPSRSTLSVSDWKERLAPHLSTSLQTVSDRMTQTKDVQDWLQEASMAAAEGLGEASGMQGEMQGYVRMMDDLENSLPALLQAVDELTDGCGTVDLHWRPLQPNFSRLSVDFGQDYSVKLFVALSDCTPDAAREAIATVAEALPRGTPFPNRPNTVTGFAARDGGGVGVRIKEHLADDENNTYRSVTLLPGGDASPIEGLSPSDAAQSLLDLLCAGDTPD